VPTLDDYYEEFSAPMDYIQEDDAFPNMKELLTGLNRDEGTLFLLITNPELFRNNTFPQLKTKSETREYFVKLSTNRSDFSEKTASFAAEGFIRGPEIDSPLNNIRRLAGVLGDFLVVCPTIFLADEMIARNKTVYMYFFDHRPKSSKFDEWLGVVHYEEVPFVFGYPLRKPKLYNEQDIEFSKRIMKIWSHFAKYG
jgi:acetylcholinesterase/cholinesterase